MHKKDVLRILHVQLLRGNKRIFFPLKDILFFYGVHMIITANEKKQESCAVSVFLAPLLGEKMGLFIYFEILYSLYKKVLLRILSSKFHQQQSLDTVHLETREVTTAINIFQ